MRWEEKSLDELGFVGRGKSKHRPRDAAYLYGGPYPFVQTGDVKHAELYLTSFSQTYSEAGLAQSKIWPAGTLCITIAANIAESAILGLDACFPDSVIGFIGDDSKCDTRFLKYKLDTVKHQYQQISQGAAQDNLSLEKLLAFRLDVPSVQVQRRVADILCCYDDLIENNRRRMVLLEQAARLLYEEWFVRLRFPGHEHTRIVDGVPEGWELVPLQDALVLQRGFDLTEREREEGEVPVCGSTGPIGVHSKWKAKAPGVVTGRSGTLGEVYYIDHDYWPHNTSLWVRDFKRVTPLFALFLLREMRLEQYNGGVSVPTLDRNAVHRVPVSVPARDLLELFDRHVSPLFSQVSNLRQQNERLREARDLLLPRLMSGGIAI